MKKRKKERNGHVKQNVVSVLINRLTITWLSWADIWSFSVSCSFWKMPKDPQTDRFVSSTQFLESISAVALIHSICMRFAYLWFNTKCEWIGIDVSIDISIEFQLERNDHRHGLAFVRFRLISIQLVCIIGLILSYRGRISTAICRRRRRRAKFVAVSLGQTKSAPLPLRFHHGFSAVPLRFQSGFRADS